MIEFLFLDLDDTILDFHKAERIALSKTIADFGVEPTEHVLHRYHLINKAHWEMLERGELTREQVLVGRFRTLFEELSTRVLSGSHLTGFISISTPLHIMLRKTVSRLKWLLRESTMTTSQD